MAKDLVCSKEAVFGAGEAVLNGRMVRNTIIPTIPPGGITGGLVFLIIAIVGTTIVVNVADKEAKFWLLDV